MDEIVDIIYNLEAYERKLYPYITNYSEIFELWEKTIDNTTEMLLKLDEVYYKEELDKINKEQKRKKLKEIK